MAGVLWGGSGRIREAWREKEPHPKGGFFSLQGLSLIPYTFRIFAKEPISFFVPTFSKITS